MVAVTALGVFPSAAAAATCAWHATPLAEQGGVVPPFWDVAATSEADAWLFPAYQGTHLERWNGSAWSDTGTSLGLGSVAADADGASDVWAVSGLSSAHFDGVSWTSHPLIGTVNAYAVSVVSPTLAVEGGDKRTGGAQVERWNGTRWRTMPAPDAYYVSALSAVSKDDIWAVVDAAGQMTLAHWDGAAWTIMQVNPNYISMRSVAARSATNVWAVGTAFSFSDTYHFDGVSWSEVPLPATSPTGVDLNDVSAESGSPTIAVGGAGASHNRKPYIVAYHPQTGAWKQEKADPVPDGFADFQHVSVVPGSDDGWALERTFAEHRTCL